MRNFSPGTDGAMSFSVIDNVAAQPRRPGHAIGADASRPADSPPAIALA